MDNSETYIKQCDCPEIQDLVIPCNIRQPDYLSQCGADMSKTGDWFHLAVWLPTQDRLQAMVEGTHTEKFGRAYRAVVEMALYPTDSMEQLWLAFYMLEKYDKVWDGEAWALGVAVGTGTT